MENLLPFLPFLQFVALAALVVFGLRWFIRRPRNVSQVDPRGVRTTALFSGGDAEFFRDDREDQPLVGVRLFGMVCDGLAHRGIVVTNRRNVQCAQGADCLVENERFGLVLEYLDPDWLISVDWAPQTAAERRHVTLTHQIFAPRDSDSLRRLLETLDAWLKNHPQLSRVRWLRKEDWLAEDVSNPADRPLE